MLSNWKLRGRLDWVGGEMEGTCPVCCGRGEDHPYGALRLSSYEDGRVGGDSPIRLIRFPPGELPRPGTPLIQSVVLRVAFVA